LWRVEAAPRPPALPAEIVVVVGEDASWAVELAESCSSAHLMERGKRGDGHVSDGRYRRRKRWSE